VNAEGTGSEPPSHNGWQRAKRQTAKMPPRAAPKRAIATRAYSEQLGSNRQRDPNSGLNIRL